MLLGYAFGKIQGNEILRRLLLAHFFLHTEASIWTLLLDVYVIYFFIKYIPDCFTVSAVQTSTLVEPIRNFNHKENN